MMIEESWPADVPSGLAPLLRLDAFSWFLADIIVNTQSRGGINTKQDTASSISCPTQQIHQQDSHV